MKKLTYLATMLAFAFTLFSCSKEAAIETKVKYHVQPYNRNADYAITSPEQFQKFRTDNVYPFNKLTETTFQTLLHSMNFNVTGNFFSFSNTGNLHNELTEKQDILKFYELVYGEKRDISYPDGRYLKAVFDNPLLKPACVSVQFPGKAYPTNNTCNCCTTDRMSECWSTCP